MFSCNLSLPWPMGPGPPGHILRVSLMWDQFTFFFPEKCQTGTVISSNVTWKMSNGNCFHPCCITKSSDFMLFVNGPT